MRGCIHPSSRGGSAAGSRRSSTGSWLAAPAALDYLEELGTGAVREHNRALALRARSLLTERWESEPAAPEDMTGPMTTIPMPRRLGTDPDQAARVRDRLLFEHRIEVQVHAWQERIWARVSAQVYNDDEDLERLAAAALSLRS
jgi:isopenicillin-N epimerase